MRVQLATLRQIAELRTAGFAVPWSLQLRMTPDTQLEFGHRCAMGQGSILTAESGRLRLGSDVSFGAYNYVTPADSYIDIGSRLLCSPFVSLIALNHEVIDGVVSWTARGGEGGITIGDDCWLATNSVVLPGVTLGDRCILAAGAVVTKSFPADTKLAGVPARPI